MRKTITKNLVWTTANGKKMTLAEMDTTHIKNSIKKIESSGGTWRGEYLEPLVEELKRRNLAIARGNLTDKVDTITDEEKRYFLETSCEYEVFKIKRKDVSSLLKELGDSLLTNYFNKNYFVIDPTIEHNQEEFINGIVSDLTHLRNCRKNKKSGKFEKIYDMYNKYLLDNVFTDEWKSFIDLMLGRRNKK